MAEIDRELFDLKKRVALCEGKIMGLENYTRSNSLVIRNLDAIVDEDSGKLERKVVELLKIIMPGEMKSEAISVCHRLNGKLVPYPVVVSLIHKKFVDILMRNGRKLKELNDNRRLEGKKMISLARHYEPATGRKYGIMALVKKNMQKDKYEDVRYNIKNGETYIKWRGIEWKKESEVIDEIKKYMPIV